MRLYNDVIQESQLVYGDHAEYLNINSKELCLILTYQPGLLGPKISASFLHNLVVSKRTRRLSGQLPLTSVGEWCASVVNL